MYMTCLADYLYPLINESSAHQREFAGDIISPVLQRNTQKNSQVFKVQDRKPRLLGALEGWAAGTSSSHGWEINRFLRFFVAEEKMEENGEMYGKCDYVFHMCSICDLPMCSICVLYKDDLPMCSICEFLSSHI